MADFNPQPHDRLTIGGLPYQVMPHPAVPSFAFGQEGRKAFVFQLSGGPDQGLYALKKFKEAFRLPELVEINNKLARFAGWPGLEVCNRECLHNGRHADILDEHPDLEFAVLMPWIGGSTWYDMVIGMTPISRLEAMAYANAAAQVLAALEEAGLAHCDISAANVIINPNTNRAHLIDVEDLYAPGFTAPAAKPAGTDGYAHDTVKGGYWGPDADRFSGAVIISEMAAWHVPEIRKQAEDEHYFAPEEMQDDSPRYQLMKRVLAGISPKMAELFDEAWFSPTLADAPPMKAWQEVISEAYQRENVARVAPEWRSLSIPGAQPASDGEQPAAQPEPQASQPAPEAVSQPEQQTAPQPQAAEEDEQAAQPTPEPASQPAATPASTAANNPPPAVQPNLRPTPQQQTQPPASPQSAPSSSASRPIQVQRSPQTGGPVVEWRPLNMPASQAPAPAARSTQGNRPIMPPVAEQDDEPEPEPEPAAQTIAQPQAEAEPSMPAPETVEEADEQAAPPEESAEAVEEASEPVADEMFIDELSEETAVIPAVIPEEIVEDEPVEVYEEPAVAENIDEAESEELPYDDFDSSEIVDEYAEEDVYTGEVDEAAWRSRMQNTGLLKPLIDLTHIDERNRPHLVWTESPGAEVYVLQEDENDDFGNPREYTIKASAETRWSPPPWPLWRRTGRLHYRLRAEAGEDAGPWSDVLRVRIGRE